LAEQLPAVVHLLSIPGIGLLTATALFAFVGKESRYPFQPGADARPTTSSSAMADATTASAPGQIGA